MLKTYIAKLDNIRVHPKNFAAGEFCLRFTGFAKKDLPTFRQTANPVTIVQIEVQVLPSFRSYALKPCNRLTFAFRDQDDEERLYWNFMPGGFGPFVNDGWVEIDVSESPRGTDYVYPLFSDDGFTRSTVQKIIPHHSLSDFCNLMALAPPGNVISHSFNLFPIPLHANYRYYGIYVGQGMTTCLQSDSRSDPTIFFDLGGGTPLLKQDYPLIKGALHARLSAAENILILSHWDDDHWRLMCWDQVLMNKMRWLAPNTNISDPLFRDHRIQQSLLSKALMLCASDFYGTVSHKMHFECFRHPNLKDKNYDGIYTILRRHETHGAVEALMTGDLPYRKVKAALGTSAFDHRFSSVVVPHHGDSESARHVPVPSPHARALAFFSAGDAQSYNHPRQASLDAHHRFSSINCRMEIQNKARQLFDADTLL